MAMTDMPGVQPQVLNEFLTGPSAVSNSMQQAVE